MSKIQRLRARVAGKHYAKQGFANFSQFVRTIRTIEMPNGEDLTSEQVALAWVYVQKFSAR